MFVCDVILQIYVYVSLPLNHFGTFPFSKDHCFLIATSFSYATICYYSNLRMSRVPELVCLHILQYVTGLLRVLSQCIPYLFSSNLVIFIDRRRYELFADVACTLCWSYPMVIKA